MCFTIIRALYFNGAAHGIQYAAELGQPNAGTSAPSERLVKFFPCNLQPSSHASLAASPPIADQSSSSPGGERYNGHQRRKIEHYDHHGWEYGGKAAEMSASLRTLPFTVLPPT